MKLKLNLLLLFIIVGLTSNAQNKRCFTFQVKNNYGKFLENVKISVFGPKITVENVTGSNNFIGLTDTDGEVTFCKKIDLGVRVSVRISEYGYVPFEKVYIIEKNPLKPFSVLLKPKVPIVTFRGKVTDGQNKPIEGVKVNLEPKNSSSAVFTNEFGLYSLEIDGKFIESNFTYSLHFSKNKYVQQPLKLEELPKLLKKCKNTKKCEYYDIITLRQKTNDKKLIINGTVSNFKNKPIKGVSIKLVPEQGSQKTQTDQNGYYSLNIQKTNLSHKTSHLVFRSGNSKFKRIELANLVAYKSNFRSDDYLRIDLNLPPPFISTSYGKIFLAGLAVSAGCEIWHYSKIQQRDNSLSHETQKLYQKEANLLRAASIISLATSGFSLYFYFNKKNKSYPSNLAMQ